MGNRKYSDPAQLRWHPDIVYPVCECVCHRTDRPYTYEGSVDEVHDHMRKEAEDRWEIIKIKGQAYLVYNYL